MIKNRLLEQFRSFFSRNYPDDMETQIEYFSIFGGLGWEVDTTKDIDTLVEELILDNFVSLRKKIEELTLADRGCLRLLRALAVGDRKIFSAFNRAGLNNANGGSALNFLEQKGLIQIEFSREEPARSLNPKGKLKREVARYRISHKVLFTHPFIRFWFYFVAPHAREIEALKYETFFKDFHKRRHSYTSLVFEELSEVLLNYNLRDSQILSSGSYWDANIEIDILTITKDEMCIDVFSESKRGKDYIPVTTKNITEDVEFNIYLSSLSELLNHVYNTEVVLTFGDNLNSYAIRDGIAWYINSILV